MSEGSAVTIGRALRESAAPANGRWSLAIGDHENGIYTNTTDVLELECHGLSITHLDALNHFGVDGHWYKGARASEREGVSISDLAALPIATRCVFLDITEARGTPWVDVNSPVTGRDLEAALARTGAALEDGDALLIYMGRDRYEAAGYEVRPILESPEGRPGIGEDGSRWLAGSPVSLVGWDFADSHLAGTLALSVHLLIWAIGLALIDNCDFSALRSVITAKRERTGMLVVSPPKIPGATGSIVNPVVLL